MITRTLSTAVVAALLCVTFTGCCCIDQFGVCSTGCGTANCPTGDCGFADSGLGGGAVLADGGCADCSGGGFFASGPDYGGCGGFGPGFRPGMAVLSLLNNVLTCGAGCGGLYIDEWYNDPPDCNEACGFAKNCGPGAPVHLWGRRFRCSGCSQCGRSGIPHAGSAGSSASCSTCATGVGVETSLSEEPFIDSSGEFVLVEGEHVVEHEHVSHGRRQAFPTRARRVVRTSHQRDYATPKAFRR